MPIVCIDRPNRAKKRTYTARDVGRIACFAVKAGETPAEIVKELEECLGQELCDRERVKQLLLDYLTSMEAFFDVLSILIGVVIGLFLPMIRFGQLILRIGAAKIIKFLPKKVRIQLQELTNKGINELNKTADSAIGELNRLRNSLSEIIKDI